MEWVFCWSRRMGIMMHLKERRIKIVRIATNLLLHLLNGRVKLLELEQIPDDAEIVGFHHDFARNTYKFAVYSETFDIVRDGCIPLYLTDFWTVEQLEQSVRRDTIW